MIEVAVANEQRVLNIDAERLRAAASMVLAMEGPGEAAVSIAVVDDATIHALNRQFLNHDYPTDVLSFVLDEGEDSLDGEIIVSAEMALAQSSAFGWGPDEELLLYVIHGALHLVGYDDQSSEGARAMRDAEARYLRQLGAQQPPIVVDAPQSNEGGIRR